MRHGRLLLILGLLVAVYVVVALRVSTGEPPPPHAPREVRSTTLSGPWTVAADPADTGLARGWPAGRFGGRRVQVPFAANAAAAARGGAALARAFRGSFSWYRTAFRTRYEGDFELDFDSVDRRARVWVDGVPVGHHEGGDAPFRVVFHATAGMHRLVVRADYRRPQTAATFNYGGIDRRVRLLPVGPVEISLPVVTTHLRPDGAATVDVSALVHNRGFSRPVELHGRLDNGRRHYILKYHLIRLARDASRRITARVTVRRPALWAPGRARRSGLVLAVPGLAHWSGHTGLRQLTWASGRLSLNGAPVVLRGATLTEDAYGHGDALTAGDIDRIVGELRAIGADAVRAERPLSPALLERLDAAGIMVWQGVGGPGAVQRALEAQLHPSIVGWGLGAGAGDAQAVALHTADPSRPVGASPAAPAVHLDAVVAGDPAGSPRDLVATFPSRLVVVAASGAPARTLARRVGAYVAAPGLTGIFAGSLRDFLVGPGFRAPTVAGGRDTSGLFTYRGAPRPTVAVVRRRFAAAG